ncbi:MAG: sulfite exporter TauE/SafE family protein, partial [Bacteroidetes bacterium]|nr:sulfite exporter TauE/SafE family protein [Bacteroidota bacterium]
MVVVGFILSIFIGITLGLIGGGGSILTVPVLVYLFHVDPVTATGYSLFVVGVTSAIGSIRYFHSKSVNFKAAMVFGIPSMLAVYLTRSLI